MDQDSHSSAKKIKKNLERFSVIHIGDWCIFQNVENSNQQNEILDNIIVGCVLGFKYVNGKTQKEIQYALDYATLPQELPSSNSSSDRQLGVLATWYQYTQNSMFLSLTSKQHFFVDINNYIATIKAPKLIKHPNKNITSFKIDENIADFNETLVSVINISSSMTHHNVFE